MAEAIYVLCAVTCVICATLLLRGFLRTRVRLLLWSGLTFVGLALNNGVLLLDLVLFPTIDLALARSLGTTLGLLPLLFGLVWES